MKASNEQYYLCFEVFLSRNTNTFLLRYLLRKIKLTPYFGLTFIMRLRWQDPRMMFPDIQGEKTLNNKTILTMDLKFLDELWVPGKADRIYFYLYSLSITLLIII